MEFWELINKSILLSRSLMIIYWVTKVAAANILYTLFRLSARFILFIKL